MLEAVTGNSVPALRRGVRRQFDVTRGENVLLGPERVVVLDDIANEIASLCDGKATITKISSLLAEKFSEDVHKIEPDVIGFIQELVDKGLIVT